MTPGQQRALVAAQQALQAGQLQRAEALLQPGHTHQARRFGADALRPLRAALAQQGIVTETFTENGEEEPGP